MSVKSGQDPMAAIEDILELYEEETGSWKTLSDYPYSGKGSIESQFRKGTLDQYITLAKIQPTFVFTHQFISSAPGTYLSIISDPGGTLRHLKPQDIPLK